MNASRRGLALMLSALAGVAFAQPSAIPVDPAARVRGFCYEAPRRRPEHNPFEELAALGCTWVSLTPFAHMRSDRDPGLRFDPEAEWWGESDAGIAESARQARAAGLRVMLKPHIWLRPEGDSWHGSIRMTTPEDWDEWFDRYASWMTHMADLASREQMDALVVGHELPAASLDPSLEEEWRRVIAEVRVRTGARLVWSAHWEREFEHLPFWDAVDVMGLSLYAPVCPTPNPSPEAIAAGWATLAGRIEAVARRWNRPVLLTEVGFRSSADAAARPWLWRSDAPLDLALQACLYENLFLTCWDQPWMGGVFVWKWEAPPRAGGGGDLDFTPQGKPALEVIRAVFTAAARVEPAEADD